MGQVYAAGGEHMFRGALAGSLPRQRGSLSLLLAVYGIAYG